MYTLFTCVGALDSFELHELMRRAVEEGFLNFVDHLVTECEVDVNGKFKLRLLDIIIAKLFFV